LSKTLNSSVSDSKDYDDTKALVYESFYPVFFQKEEKIELQNLNFSSNLHNWKYKNVICFQLIYNSFQPPEITI